MKTIVVTFLGTADAFPTEKRNHSAIVLEVNGESILVDCGEGTQRQFKIAKLNSHKIAKILVTHTHGDHVFGLPGLFASLAMGEHQKKLLIVGPPGMKNHLVNLEKTYGRFKLDYQVQEGDRQKIDENEYAIESLPMKHSLATNAYSFTIKAKRRINKEKLARAKVPNTPLLHSLQQGKDIMINGKKLKAKEFTYLEPQKKVAIILDTGSNENTIKIARDADLLICESTYASSEKKYAADHQHLTAEQAATIAKKAKVKQLILTHISQRYEARLQDIEKEARKIFKNTRIARDFDKITI